MTTLDLVEGWTGPVPVTLEGDGAAVPLGGKTVAIALYDRDGTEVNAAGDVTVTGAAAGEVDWYPDAADLSATLSPYELRFTVTDSNGLDIFVPNKLAVAVVVRR